MKKLTLIVFFFSLLSITMANNIEKGVEMFESKNYYGARKFFTEFIQQNPEHPVAHYYLGRIDFEENKYDNAISNFGIAIRKDDKNHLYYFWRGRTNLNLLMEANMVMKAVYSGRTLKDFEKAVELNPDDLESRIYLAEYYGQAPSIAGGSVTKSIAQFRTAIQKHPQVPYLYQGIGNQYRNSAKYDSAFYFYKKGIEINPNDAMFHYEIGKTGAVSGKELQFAENALIKAQKMGLGNGLQSDAYFQLGRVQEQLNKKSQAKIAYQECLKLNSDHSECKKALRKLN